MAAVRGQTELSLHATQGPLATRYRTGWCEVWFRQRSFVRRHV